MPTLDATMQPQLDTTRLSDDEKALSSKTDAHGCNLMPDLHDVQALTRLAVRLGLVDG
jgi:hypothetical protein